MSHVDGDTLRQLSIESWARQLGVEFGAYSGPGGLAFLAFNGSTFRARLPLGRIDAQLWWQATAAAVAVELGLSPFHYAPASVDDRRVEFVWSVPLEAVDIQ